MSSSQEPNILKMGDFHKNNSLSEKILGITFDCKLKFKKDIENICHLQDLHHNWEQLKNVFL